MNKNVKASPCWELLWQTLISQWFIFYSQCNRAKWAQPYAILHWCASFQLTLFLGNRCSSALLGASDGPIHKSQLSMNDHSLSCSAIDQHHSGPCPPVTVKKGVLGKWLRKGGLVVICLKVRSSRFNHSVGGLGDHPALGLWVSWRSQGLDWGWHPVVLQSPH